MALKPCSTVEILKNWNTTPTTVWSIMPRNVVDLSESPEVIVFDVTATPSHVLIIIKDELTLKIKAHHAAELKWKIEEALGRGK